MGQEVHHVREHAQALLSLYVKSVDAQRILRGATQEIADRLLHSDNQFMRYFGVDIDDAAQKDCVVLQLVVPQQLLPSVHARFR